MFFKLVSKLGMHGGTDIQEKEGDKTSPSKKHTESVTEGSTDAETSRGSVGQVAYLLSFAVQKFFVNIMQIGVFCNTITGC